jgi:hypothetical protein
VITTGIERSSSSELLIHPNPTDDQLFIHLPASLSTVELLTLFDGAGREVLQVAATGPGIALLDLSGLESGLYLLRTSSGATSRVVLR